MMGRTVLARWGVVLAATALTGSASPLLARQAATAVLAVSEHDVHAHVSFLAGDALQGRGSATRDEAIAAAYVASQFAQYGLATAPGMDGYLQTATIVRPRLEGTATLTVDGKAVPGLSLLFAGGNEVTGSLGVARATDGSDMPATAIVVADVSPGPALQPLVGAAMAKGVRLLILRAERGVASGPTVMQSYLDGMAPPARPTIAVLPDAERARLVAAAAAGKLAKLTLGGVVRERATTTNAVGYLPGADPAAGVLLVSAHLDHLGVQKDGTVMHGANDDASGTVAVIELARALARSAGPGHRRGILFVCYGSEEIGGYGSRWFAAHPPVPLDRIVANLEIEMIGAQDPKLPAGTMMMTGFDRSNFGPTLKAHGALVTADPYPDQNFFRRSDNYSLALEGVVAHTVSGWAVTPTYHTAGDTVDSLDIPFMTRAIQSLVEPLRWMADGDFAPAWAPGGRPTE